MEGALNPTPTLKPKPLAYSLNPIAVAGAYKDLKMEGALNPCQEPRHGRRPKPKPQTLNPGV